jgi:hypothetical protein
VFLYVLPLLALIVSIDVLLVSDVVYTILIPTAEIDDWVFKLKFSRRQFPDFLDLLLSSLSMLSVVVQTPRK